VFPPINPSGPSERGGGSREKAVKVETVVTGAHRKLGTGKVWREKNRQRRDVFAARLIGWACGRGCGLIAFQGSRSECRKMDVQKGCG